ncbi:hypothetical protein M514_22881 [Trichuris suis]|uniref:Uncharacterized protein n=1 Tax=Trichuris suis TaxID=68888 RepID=A0A085N642_9BILA|nr:hypothetical protein M514_22881 [Trichuris suis]
MRRPTVVTGKETVALVRGIEKEDRRIMIRRIANMVRVSLDSAFAIVHETLGLRKLPARWFLIALCDEQLI